MKIYIALLLGAVFLLLLTPIGIYSNNNTKKSIIEVDKKVIDTTRNYGTAASVSIYTPEQDSAYRAALKLNIPFMVRAYNDLERSELIWNLWKQQTENTAGSALKNSFHSIPAEIFLPMNTEIIQRQIGIVNALSIPGYTFQAPSMGIGSGMSFDFYKAGVFLGIFEDVSPTIKYDLSITADVVVVVYSIQAKAIATLFNGMQTPGSYTVTWNGRDDQGKKMEMGDYFIEVKIGTEKFVRKRVRIGDYK